eukprot:6984725-Prymnesium_polylepis.1
MLTVLAVGVGRVTRFGGEAASDSCERRREKPEKIRRRAGAAREKPPKAKPAQIKVTRFPDPPRGGAGGGRFGGPSPDIVARQGFEKVRRPPTSTQKPQKPPPASRSSPRPSSRRRMPTQLVRRPGLSTAWRFARTAVRGRRAVCTPGRGRAAGSREPASHVARGP